MPFWKRSCITLTKSLGLKKIVTPTYYLVYFSVVPYQAIKAKDAWNSPEKATDFPCCDFLISHLDQTKQQFFCGITASHGLDSANTEVVSLFEQVKT